ncbi:MAG: excinuclease ABC subunit UvrC [Proteobacteria bacterium]|nr:excinuclease ABC subunit UvrC [Pseudomonadota bacterium]
MEEKVKELIKTAPQNPGVYIFKNSEGLVIYVGKARKLRDRLKHYVQYLRSDDPKLRILGSSIFDLELIRTNNELEALILESNLIKKHKPRYNIQLKDDKAYPYIKINMMQDWPMLEIVRRFSDDGALYFGPYLSATSLRSLINVINKAFPLRKCSDNILRTAKRPCINYQIHTCLAPCQGYIKKEDYMGIVKGVISVLKGKTASVIEELEKEMLLASDNLDFEEAARIRERIKILESLYSRQSVVMPDDTRDIDVISCKALDDSHAFNILLIRGGILLGQTNVVVQGGGTDREALDRVLIDYYSKNMIPDLLNVPFDVFDETVINFIKNMAGNKKVTIGKKMTSDIKMVRKIGEASLEEYIKTLNIRKGRWENVSLELTRLLRVKRNAIRTIECYDMSNISGKFAVGARVFFADGSPVKNNYRKYKMRGDYRGDDLKAMQEVFSRRLKKTELEPLPDLIILDGGRTQLNAVYRVMIDNGFKDYRMISIAKDKETSKGLSKDKIYSILDGEMVTLIPGKELLNFIKMIRDEAHRFVISYHRYIRRKG